MNYEMTIIVPVYNEEDNLDRVFKTFKEYLGQSDTKSKVMFIDDGSTDGSFERIESICEGNSEFEYLKLNRNCGLSAAIKAGIDNITAPLIGYIDADLQTTPFDF